ncbi:MAG: lipid A deacylase LpxR family protein [Pseudomonadales bacterium]
MSLISPIFCLPMAFAVVSTNAFGASTQTVDERGGLYWSEGRTWQVEWHNDAFANSDNQFTNGIKVGLHSALATSLDDTRGTPAFGKLLARLVLPKDDSLHYRESWSIGQNLQTPDDLTADEIILNDVPYVGMIGISSGFTAFDEQRLTGFGLLLGWTGKTVLGEQVQSAVHEITSAPDPAGWDNQLDFEPLINLYYSRKHKLWNLPGFSGSITGDLALGNFFTFAQASLDLRLGNAPQGFHLQPAPVGRIIEFDASLREPGARYTYLSFTARTTGIAHSLPRDGNLLRSDNEWTENNVVNPERWVQQFVLGLHHERPRWGLHLSFWYSSDTVKSGDELFDTQDPQNSFGTITVDFRPRG